MAFCGSLLRVSQACSQVLIGAVFSSELQDSLRSSCGFGRIHFLVVVELVTACFFKASRRISEVEDGPSLSFKGLT